MQTLNVDAVRSDKEHQEAEERRRADLRADSQNDANFFFWAAGLAALTTGLLPIRLNMLVNVGVLDLLRAYGTPLGPRYSLALYGTIAAWMGILVALGFAARAGHRWAFLGGMALFGADMIALIMTFSIWAFGVHAFFVFRWFQGQKALQDLNQSGTVTF